MAKKKSTTAATAPLSSIQKNLNNHENPKDLQPEITKINNLKTLNQLLVKETMEKRSEIDSLKSQIDEMKECQSFMSKLENDVCRIVIGTAVFEKSKVNSSLVEKLSSLEQERDFVKNDLEGKVKELEMENIAIRDELGQALIERDEKERMWKKKEEAFDSLQELMEDVEKEKDEMGMKFEEEASLMKQKVDEYVTKIQTSEKEALEVNDANRILKGEVGVLRGENEGLRIKVDELEVKDRVATEEISKIRANFIAVEKEKEEMKGEFENKFRNLKMGYEEKNGKAKEELDNLTLTISLLKKEKDEQEMEYKSKFNEFYQRFDEKIEETQIEVARLRENIVALEKEKEELENKFEAETKELGSQLVESNKKLGDVLRERDELEKVSGEQAVEIAELKKGIEILNSRVLMFEEKCREFNEKNTKLLDEMDAVKIKSDLLQQEMLHEKEDYESKVKDLRIKLEESQLKVNAIAKEKEDTAKEREASDKEIIKLKKEVEELGSTFTELEKKYINLQNERAELVMNLEESQLKISAISKERDDLEKGREDSNKETIKLKEDVEKLSFSSTELEKKCLSLQNERTELLVKLEDSQLKLRTISEEKDDIEKERTAYDEQIVELKKKVEKASSNLSELEKKNSKLQSENDAVKTELSAERKASEELKRKNDESIKELKQLNASLNELASENDAAKKQVESLEKKMKAAEMISEKSLTLLKRAKHAIHESENTEENGEFYDKEIQPFGEELESIKGAFKSRTLKIEEMNREVAMLKEAVKETETKKPGLLMRLYPAFTTVLAAISLAYAARAR